MEGGREMGGFETGDIGKERKIKLNISRCETKPCYERDEGVREAKMF